MFGSGDGVAAEIGVQITTAQIRSAVNMSFLFVLFMFAVFALDGGDFIAVASESKPATDKFRFAPPVARTRRGCRGPAACARTRARLWIPKSLETIPRVRPTKVDTAKVQPD